MAEHPESYSGWYGFESRWVHVEYSRVITWAVIGLVFLVMSKRKWNPYHRSFGYTALVISAAFAVNLPWLAMVIIGGWYVLLAWRMYDLYKDGKRLSAEVKEREAELLASFQEHVSRWPCPHCGQHDFRVLPPVYDPIVECAECRYRIAHLP